MGKWSVLTLGFLTHRLLSEFSGNWERKCLNENGVSWPRFEGFSLPTRLCTGYSVKLETNALLEYRFNTHWRKLSWNKCKNFTSFLLISTWTSMKLLFCYNFCLRYCHDYFFILIFSTQQFLHTQFFKLYLIFKGIMIK